MSLLDISALKKLAPALEAAINTTLAMDPAGAKKLKPLEGCVLELNITSLDQSIFFLVEKERIKLQSADLQPTVTLSGSSSALLKLAFQKDKNSLFKRKEVSLSGDAVRAQQILTFASAISIDWEGLLGEAIGETPAHLLTTGLQSGFIWGKNLTSSFRQDLEEFVKYELRLLPSRAIAATQFEAIDQLRLATDRLEAKFKHLVRQKSKRDPSCQS